MPNPSPKQIADIVTAAQNEGYDTLVAEMPNGQIRIFADTGSKTYSKKVYIVLPDKFIKKGTSWIAQYKSKEVSAEKAKEIREKIAKGDKKLRAQFFTSNGVPRLKSGKVRLMSLRAVQKRRMELRRDAGYEPVHHRPGTKPALRKAVQKAWDKGVGDYKGIHEHHLKAEKEVSHRAAASSKR